MPSSGRAFDFRSFIAPTTSVQCLATTAAINGPEVLSKPNHVLNNIRFLQRRCAGSVEAIGQMWGEKAKAMPLFVVLLIFGKCRELFIWRKRSDGTQSDERGQVPCDVGPDGASL